jgi:hypothetical protein
MRSANLAAEMISERVRLDAGRHASPGEGACVVELASLVAREKFSDRPECVCPVIAAFLRGWNDRVAYADRQRLRPYARRIVNTRASRSVTRWRRDLCLGWVGIELGGGPVRRLARRLAVRIRIATFCGMRYGIDLEEGAAEYAARVLYGRREVESAFGLLDALLAATGNGVVHVRPGRIPWVEPVATNGAAANGGAAADKPELEHV